jgi:hypothetical protein
MEFNACAQCGAEIKSKGIHFRGKDFCSDECCEEFEARMVDKGVPALDELEKDDLDPEDLGEDLGYRNGDDDDELLDEDDGDDFKIAPEDF